MTLRSITLKSLVRIWPTSAPDDDPAFLSVDRRENLEQQKKDVKLYSLNHYNIATISESQQLTQLLN